MCVVCVCVCVWLSTGSPHSVLGLQGCRRAPQPEVKVEESGRPAAGMTSSLTDTVMDHTDLLGRRLQTHQSISPR